MFTFDSETLLPLPKFVMQQMRTLVDTQTLEASVENNIIINNIASLYKQNVLNLQLDY